MCGNSAITKDERLFDLYKLFKKHLRQYAKDLSNQMAVMSRVSGKDSFEQTQLKPRELPPSEEELVCMIVR